VNPCLVWPPHHDWDKGRRPVSTLLLFVVVVFVYLFVVVVFVYLFVVVVFVYLFVVVVAFVVCRVVVVVVEAFEAAAVE
jgi:hypothetical protein